MRLLPVAGEDRYAVLSVCSTQGLGGPRQHRTQHTGCALPLQPPCSDYLREHKQCFENRRTLVVELGDFRELHLAPLYSLSGARTA